MQEEYMGGHAAGDAWRKQIEKHFGRLITQVSKITGQILNLIIPRQVDILKPLWNHSPLKHFFDKEN